MDVRTGLRNAFMGGPRRSRPPTTKAVLQAAHKAYGNWKAVAAAMGVSDRTLRRVRNEGKVSASSAAKVRGLDRTPEVRRASVAPRTAAKNAQRSQRGARVSIYGKQGPVGFNPDPRSGDYHRKRTIEFNIPEDRMDEIQAAFFEGDDERAEQLLADAATEFYGEGSLDSPERSWSLGDLDSLDFE